MVGGAIIYGEERSGHAEIIRNSRGIDQIAFRSAANLANRDGVEEFSEGEFATLNAAGEAAKLGASPTGLAYLVLIGKERTDVRGSRTTALVVGSGYHAETSGFFLDVTYTASDYSLGVRLTAVKDAADGIGKLRPAASTEPIVATCLSGVRDVLSDAGLARGDTARKVITIEFLPRGFEP